MAGSYKPSVNRFNADALVGDRPFYWQEFHELRNQVLRVLRRYGTVGPMGEAPINDDPNGPDDSWPVESRRPDFFVVDDWPNTMERYIRVEPTYRLPSASVLEELAFLLRGRDRWGIELALGDGLLVITDQALMVDGPRFRKCSSLEDVVKRL